MRERSNTPAISSLSDHHSCSDLKTRKAQHFLRLNVVENGVVGLDERVRVAVGRSNESE